MTKEDRRFSFHRQVPGIDGVTYIKAKHAKTGSIRNCEIITANDSDLFTKIIG